MIAVTPGMPYKAEMFVQGSWCSNALVFAEAWEADWYASDLFSRWMGPSDKRTVEIPGDMSNVNAHVACAAATYVGSRFDQRELITIKDLVHAAPDPAIYQERARDVSLAFGVAADVLESHRERCVEPSFLVGFSRVILKSDLPEHIRRGVPTLARAEIRIEACYRKIRVSSSASDEKRAIVVTIPALGTGDRVRTEYGPWGGPNMFGTCSIDADPVREIPQGGAIIVGTEGGYLTIHAHPADVLEWLQPSDPANLVIGDLKLITPVHHNRIRDLALVALASGRDWAYGDLQPLERHVLAIYRTRNSSGRKRDLPAAGEADRVSLATDRLESLGLIKRSKSGAITVTTAGKNVQNLPTVY